MTQSTDILTAPQDQVHVPTPERRRANVQSEFAGAERRQFASSHDELSPEGRELAEAIDNYKLEHRRRYITHDETLEVVRSLGYHR